MKIISFMNHKGGVGKTTLCTNLAKAFLKEDDPLSITLVDSDPQGSLRDWHNALEEGTEHDRINIVGADRRNTLVGITNFVNSNYMFIDTPGNIKELHAAALNMSDMVIIPIRPSPYDIWATEDTIDLVRTVCEVNKRIKPALVINQAIPNTKIHKEVKELLSKFKDFFIPDAHISHRVVFAKTAALGNTVFESDDKLAMLELTSVANELLDYLYGRKSSCQ